MCRIVDLAVRLLTRAAGAEGDDAAAALHSLVESAQARIREIEEFYTQNDDGIVYYAHILHI